MLAIVVSRLSSECR